MNCLRLALIVVGASLANAPAEAGPVRNAFHRMTSGACGAASAASSCGQSQMSSACAPAMTASSCGVQSSASAACAPAGRRLMSFQRTRTVSRQSASGPATVGACSTFAPSTVTTGGLMTAAAPLNAGWPKGPVFHELFRMRMVAEIEKKVDPSTGQKFTWWKAHQMAGSVSDEMINSAVKPIAGADKVLGDGTLLQEAWAWFIANLPAILTAIMQILAAFGL